MTAWIGKPCAGCAGTKGPKQASRKFCFRCALARAKAARDASHRTRVARVYGLGREGYDRLYEAQDRRCAICRRATGATRRLSVDHDHATGAVRGLLCRPCNDMVGHGRDDPAFFDRAALYLEHPPARALLADVDAP